MQYRNNITDRKQAGFVSMFTLMFFIIIASIVTVGFLRLVITESRQAQDNSSTNNALAAARAGIEDGKRAIILYNTTNNEDLKSQIASAIASQDCRAIYGNSAISDALGIDPNGQIRTQGLDEQYYTCLTIKPDTLTYESLAQPSKSLIVPLFGDRSFSGLVVRWHKHGLDPALNTNRTITEGNPTVSQLNTQGLPSFMRLQIIKVPNETSLPGIISATGFIRTTTVAGGSLTTNASTFFAHDFPSPHANFATKPAAPTANCTVSATDYACATTINIDPAFAGFAPVDFVSSRYYLRITPVHNSVNVQVSMLDSSSATIPFLMVQPEIDVTGKSGNTLRRLKARVKFSSDVDLPEYVAEANGGDDGMICKAFTVNNTQIFDSTECPLP